MADPDRTTDPSAEPIAIGWYAVALVIYVAAGYFLKTWLLNWIIGPMFLLIVLYLIPTGVQRLVGKARRR